MSPIMKLTKHGAIIPTHTPCLVIANMVDMEAVRNCISTDFRMEKSATFGIDLFGHFLDYRQRFGPEHKKSILEPYA